MEPSLGVCPSGPASLSWRRRSLQRERGGPCWRAFVEKNKMIWPQFLDGRCQVVRAFQVNVFPTCILLDHEGIIRYRSTGGGWGKSAFIEDEIRKRLKALAKASG